MTTPTIRDLCAALSGDVDYLLACIRDGSSDPATLQECADRANTARDILKAEVVGEGPSIDDIRQLCVDNELLLFVDSSDFDTVVTAVLEIVCTAIARLAHPSAPSAPEPGKQADSESINAISERT